VSEGKEKGIKDKRGKVPATRPAGSALCYERLMGIEGRKVRRWEGEKLRSRRLFLALIPSRRDIRQE